MVWLNTLLCITVHMLSQYFRLSVSFHEVLFVGNCMTGWLKCSKVRKFSTQLFEFHFLFSPCSKWNCPISSGSVCFFLSSYITFSQKLIHAVCMCQAHRVPSGKQPELVLSRPGVDECTGVYWRGFLKTVWFLKILFNRFLRNQTVFVTLHSGVHHNIDAI